MNPTEKPHRATAGLAVLLCALLTLPSAAQAFRGHVFSTTFGSAGSGNGQLSEPSDVAINEATGRIYVLDQGNGRIEYFSSAGLYEGQFSGTGAETFEFGSTPLSAGIAVDNSCHLRKLSGGACTSADPSNEDVYVTDPGHGVIDKFSAAGAYLNHLQEASGGGDFTSENFFGETVKPEGVSGVAVDPQGTVWLFYMGAHPGSGEVARFTDAALNGSGEANTFISTHQLEKVEPPTPGFAVDSADHLYVRRISFGAKVVSKFGPLSEIGAYEPLLNPFAPEEASAVAVDLTNDEPFLDESSSIAAFDPEARLEERFGQGHLSEGQGLAVGRAANALYSNLYVADSAANRIAVFVPEPPGPPSIEAESGSVRNVSADAADLGGTITPRSEPGEEKTAYSFEYGPCEGPCEGSPYPQSASGSLPPDFEAHPVSAHLQGLAPHTAYHFRLEATNEAGGHPNTVKGEEGTFTTQALVAPGLPDSRAWELVSPPEKRGAQLKPQGILLTQAADTGEAISYLATVPTEANPLGNSNRTQLLSARGPGGWTTQDLTVPHPEATGASIGLGEEVRYFSSDLSRSVLHPFGAFEPLSPLASEQTAYVRTDFPPGEPSALCASSCYLPLVSGAEGFANVPEGTAFGEAPECEAGHKSPLLHVFCGPSFLGATPDLGHVVLLSSTALTETPLPKGVHALYEWSANAPRAESLRLISALPGGGAAGSVGEPNLARNAISADGSRVAFPAELGGHLYLRTGATKAPSPISGSAVDGSQCTEPQLACTLQLDAVQEGGGAGPAKPVFQLASADGHRVFFTDTQRLTAGSGAAEDKRDLYEYDTDRPAGERLADLTPLHEGEPASVQGLLPGASEDASYLYLVAEGDLTGSEQNARGEAAQPGRPNLYLIHAGAASFVATLAAGTGSPGDAGDRPDWIPGEESHLVALTSRVSPDGRWLAFMSKRPLTGYDNRDSASGQRDEEVFLYHAPAAAGGEGKLLCASCNPTGARPHGLSTGPQGSGLPLAEAREMWAAETWLAANLPGWNNFATGHALHQPRYLSDSGRLFFNSSDALVPADTNGTEDVYTYEPPSSAEEAPPNDTCTESSPTYSPASGGCVNLISSGASPGESAFLDASESGSDVFFLTASKLVGADKDTSLDVYDARVGGGFPEEAKPVECLGDSCQPPATPPNDQTPGSLTFNGAGNVLEEAPRPRCAKGKVRRGGKCVARKHHKAKKHRRGRGGR